MWPECHTGGKTHGRPHGSLAIASGMRYGSVMIVVVANSKGGVGKSTVAVHLAAWLRKNGRSVALADCDTQQSSSLWCREALPDIHAVRLATPDEIIEQLPILDREYDYVVADGPGSNVDTSRTLLLVAHLALVPCKASMLEVRALEQATRFIRQAHQVRSGQPKAVIILSMVGRRYRLTQDMRTAAAALSLPLAETPLILRQVYADAPGQGSVVVAAWARGAADAAAGDRRAVPRGAARAPRRSAGDRNNRRRRPPRADDTPPLDRRDLKPSHCRTVDPDVGARSSSSGGQACDPRGASRPPADRIGRGRRSPPGIRKPTYAARPEAGLAWSGSSPSETPRPNTLQEMLEEALGPWLRKSHGYLS